MASLHKRGNFWYIKYYYQKKQFWIKTKLQHDIVSFENAMRTFTKLFGSDDLTNRTIYNHQRKIKRKQKVRSSMDLDRISILSHKFLDNHNSNIRINYQSALRHLIEYTNDKYISNLTLSDLKRLYMQLLNDGKTPNTVSSIFTVIRLFFKSLKLNDFNYKLHNLEYILSHFKQFLITIPNKRPSLTDLELQLIENFLFTEDDSDFLLAYMRFSLSTGAKLSECLRGKVDKDMDFYVWKYKGNQGNYRSRTITSIQYDQWKVLQNRMNSIHPSEPLKKRREKTTNLMSKKFALACKKTLLYTNRIFLTGIAMKPIDVYGLSNTKVNKLSRRCLLFLYAKAHNKNQRALAGWEKAIAMTKIWSFQSLRNTYLEKQESDQTTKILETLS